MLGGDVLLSRSGESLFSEDYPWGSTADFLNSPASGLFAINLESPLGIFPDQDLAVAQEMNLCADSSQIHVLLEGGVDLVTRVNNHALDCLCE